MELNWIDSKGFAHSLSSCMHHNWCMWITFARWDGFPRSFYAGKSREFKTGIEVQMYNWDVWLPDQNDRSRGKKMNYTICQKHHELVLDRWGADMMEEVRELEVENEYNARESQRNRVDAEVFQRWSGRRKTSSEASNGKRLVTRRKP